MSTRTAEQIHEALDGIRDNVNPALVAAQMDDADLASIGTILSALCALAALQARTLATILEHVEDES